MAAYLTPNSTILSLFCSFFCSGGSPGLDRGAALNFGYMLIPYIYTIIVSVHVNRSQIHYSTTYAYSIISHLSFRRCLQRLM